MKKLSLDKLKVSSFVTVVRNSSALVGGDEDNRNQISVRQMANTDCLTGTEDTVLCSPCLGGPDEDL